MVQRPYYPMYMLTLCSNNESGRYVFEKKKLQIFKLVLQDLALNCWTSIGVVPLEESYEMHEFEHHMCWDQKTVKNYAYFY